MEKTVLIVDDSNTNNILLQSILESEGINSSIALSGKEAFDLIETKKPSLILLDIMMPEIDGFTVLEEIKNKPETKEIPVVFITAKNDNKVRNQAIEAGAKDLIHKPIDVKKVIDIVKKILPN
jgi:two-component system, sensor histidine kinase and response regulator